MSYPYGTPTSSTPEGAHAVPETDHPEAPTVQQATGPVRPADVPTRSAQTVQEAGERREPYRP